MRAAPATTRAICWRRCWRWRRCSRARAACPSMSSASSRGRKRSAARPARLYRRQQDTFACDFVLSADGGQWSEEQPALLVGLKGLCGAANRRRRPGLRRALWAIWRRDPEPDPRAGGHPDLDAQRRWPHPGCEGFYDDVVPLSDADRAEIARVPYDQESVRQKLGIDAFFGEPGYTTLERSWGRPTLEVNGIWGGFQGEGVKTVLPSEAHAKITCRLVANQRPEKIAALLAEHVAQPHAARRQSHGVNQGERRLALSDGRQTIPATRRHAMCWWKSTARSHSWRVPAAASR
jgi:hypothetical protein